MHSATAIARKFLEHAEKNGKTFTPMQLLKLVYIAHGWMLGLYGRPLIKDPVEAWKYGPVIPDLYRRIKHFRDQPVEMGTFVNDNEELDNFEEDLVQQAFDIYGDHSGIQLSTLTHQKQSPWDRIYDPTEYSSVIPNDVIQDYYKQKANAAA